MISKFKIFALPLFVLLLAFYAQIKEYPLAAQKTSLNKSLPFPVQPESKAQWTKPNWSTKFYKSLSPLIECSIEFRLYSPDNFVPSEIGNDFFNYESIFSSLSGRSPPLFS